MFQKSCAHHRSCRPTVCWSRIRRRAVTWSAPWCSFLVAKNINWSANPAWCARKTARGRTPRHTVSMHSLLRNNAINALSSPVTWRTRIKCRVQAFFVFVQYPPTEYWHKRIHPSSSFTTHKHTVIQIMFISIVCIKNYHHIHPPLKILTDDRLTITPFATPLQAVCCSWCRFDSACLDVFKSVSRYYYMYFIFIPPHETMFAAYKNNATG